MLTISSSFLGVKYIFQHWRSLASPEDSHSDKQWFVRFIKDACSKVDLESSECVAEKTADEIAVKWLTNRRVAEFLRRDEKCMQVQHSMSV